MKSDFTGIHDLNTYDNSFIERCKMAKNLMLLNGHDGDHGNSVVMDCRSHIGGNDTDTCGSDATGLKNDADMSNVHSLVHQVKRDFRIGSDDAKLLKTSQKSEVQHLKELLLLNLDVIHQQQDELRTKDRQIRGYQQDKESLKCRLVRMERRISVLRQKAVKQEKHAQAEALKKKAAETDSSVPASTAEKVMLKTNEVDLSQPCTVPEPSVEIEATTELAPSTPSLPPVKVTTSKATQTVALTSDTISKTRMRPHVLTKAGRGRKRTYNRVHQRGAKSTRQSTRGEQRERIKPQSRPAENEPAVACRLRKSDSLSDEENNILRAPEYYSYSIETANGDSVIDSHKKMMVEIPTWRLHPLPSCYTLEGTENIDDDIFLKRHQKFEMDEKRRKRWDIQRLREAKMLEKLESGRHGNKDKRRHSVEHPIESLYPLPDNAQVIEICNTVPVVAFGCVIPNCEQSEFGLPWLPTTQTQLSPKRKKRK
ncbi:PREDICTED: male-specific lethal 1 homolog [Priapulus caudatus]|uniref:Male-specific lethal 1 homolog n=1 Tax=Priapulus caudatus TaxID=37621 RepID=A0ABM1ETI1_PRICU|nr:PREDICTED: male-specific lethal 1 homolog [Priapulus caudatus]